MEGTTVEKYKIVEVKKKTLSLKVFDRLPQQYRLAKVIKKQIDGLSGNITKNVSQKNPMYPQIKLRFKNKPQPRSQCKNL